MSGFDALPDNTELTFEVTIGGTTVTKATALLPKPALFEDSEIGFRITRMHGTSDLPTAQGVNHIVGEGLREASESASGYNGLTHTVDDGTTEYSVTPSSISEEENLFSFSIAETFEPGEHVAHFTVTTKKAGGETSKTGTFDVKFVAS